MSLFALCVVALFSSPAGEIAFVARPGTETAQIQIIDVDTGAVRGVGIDGAQDGPRWSPDGTRIAYTADAPDGSAVYIANATGDGGAFIAGASHDASGPAWSPDGRWIAYTIGHGLDAQVAVFDIAKATETVWGGGRTSLTSPVWVSNRLAQLLIDPERQSARSLRPAFPGTESAQPLVVAVGCVGTPGAMTTDLFIVSEHDVTSIIESLMPSVGVYAEFGPAASADALAFESNDGGDREIFVISSRSTFDLSNHHAADWLPVWAPDGRAVAFQSFRSGRSGIYQCAPRRAGRVQTVVENSSGDCWGPAWSPDAQWIAYVSDWEGTPAVYAIRPDGSEDQRLSPPGVVADAPAWRPTP